MPVAYCVTLKELRNNLEEKGIDPATGGFYMVPDLPDVDLEHFDIWEAEIDQRVNQHEALMVRENIPANRLNRIESPSFAM